MYFLGDEHGRGAKIAQKCMVNPHPPRTCGHVQNCAYETIKETSHIQMECNCFDLVC